MGVVNLESKNDDPSEGKSRKLTEGPCKMLTFDGEGNRREGDDGDDGGDGDSIIVSELHLVA